MFGADNLVVVVKFQFEIQNSLILNFGLKGNYGKSVRNREITVREFQLENGLCIICLWQDHADNLINLGCQCDNAEFLLVWKRGWHVRWKIAAILLKVAKQLK